MDPITYNFTGAIQNYTVTVTGSYTLTAYGAQGGTDGRNAIGGQGASVEGTFTLQANSQLLVLVGGQGSNATSGGAGGGGGGGSFVYDDVDKSGTINAGDVLLLAAGGGGGAGFRNIGAGGTGTDVASGTGTGGTVGAGTRNGGGGAGVNGGGDTSTGGSSGTGAASIQNNGAGGGTLATGGNGGYGGGGGGGFNGGGGGGGYSGGNGGTGSETGPGLGGTSYFNTARGTQTVTSSGTNAGNGSVRVIAPAQPVQPAAPCYVTGTRIRVLRGLAIQDVPVERLRVSDLALTASGKPRPIRWIGSRSYPGLTAPRHDRPVRIKAGALADGVPARDLLVSPDHCLWLDGLLVAAGHLVNGTSITRGEAVADLTYWHVELDIHDMLQAEGAAAESFLAAPGVRAGFDGTHRPDAATVPVPYAVRTGRGAPALDALCERLVLQAGLSIEPVRFGAVRAWMDLCDGARVAGWAQDAAHPDAPVCLDIVVDGEIVAMTLAEEYRADIAAAGVGDGRHGFDVDLDEPLPRGVPHTVEVRRSADGERVCAMAVDAAGVWTALLAA